MEYIDDASGEPTPETINAAIGLAWFTREQCEIIAEDVADPTNQIADAAVQPPSANSDDRPPPIVGCEFLRSTGNILSGLFALLVDYARDAGSAGRKGSLGGIEAFTKLATTAIGFASSAYVASLALGLPGEFGWISQVIAFLKMKLKM